MGNEDKESIDADEIVYNVYGLSEYHENNGYKYVH